MDWSPGKMTRTHPKPRSSIRVSIQAKEMPGDLAALAIQTKPRLRAEQITECGAGAEVSPDRSK
jgi:hypothetical protein